MRLPASAAGASRSSTHAWSVSTSSAVRRVNGGWSTTGSSSGRTLPPSKGPPGPRWTRSSSLARPHDVLPNAGSHAQPSTHHAAPGTRRIVRRADAMSPPALSATLALSTRHEVSALFAPSPLPQYPSTSSDGLSKRAGSSRDGISVGALRSISPAAVSEYELGRPVEASGVVARRDQETLPQARFCWKHADPWVIHPHDARTIARAENQPRAAWEPDASPFVDAIETP